ncbi:MAG TPA: alpha/beta hydrolase [Vicinamibacterales bacterium]|nr:alpha/beta hydrolase [Vicinamibacterales bacterium]
MGMVLAAMGSVACSNAQRLDAVVVEEPHRALSPVLLASGGSWSEYSVEGPAKQTRIYVAHDDQPKPIVFLLQGSGCIPSFTVDADGTYHPTSLFQDVVATGSRRVHFALVEKPGVAPLKFDAAMNQEEKLRAFELAGFRCSQEFFESATKTVRVDDVRVAMTALASQPWASGFILVGHSEGTHVATGVVKSRPAETVLAVALFASAGPTPFWGGYVAADGGSRDGFERAFDRIRMLQTADDGFMYQGLPARRWKTFWLESTPLDDVRESTVPLFVAHGTRDGTILAPDLFVVEAVRQQPARSLRYVVLENGDHAFETAPGQSRIAEIFNDFLDWALDSDRATGTTVLH